MEITKARKTTSEAFSGGKSKVWMQQEGALSRSLAIQTPTRWESCRASYSTLQELQLSKKQTKMAAAKLQFESRRKIPMLKAMRRKIWQD